MKHFQRVKHLADQTFSRSGKLDNLSDELQAADRKVDNVKSALQTLSKKLGPGNSSVAHGQDPAAREKRLKKIPEFQLGMSIQETDNSDENTLLKFVLTECGKTQMSLANEIAEHDIKVEQLVCSPLNSILEQDLPNIAKARKQLLRLISERDSAVSRYHNLRQSDKGYQDFHKSVQDQQKAVQAREEAEDAELKADQARDALASEMFALLSKEMDFAKTVLQYLKLQRGYHESALHILTEVIPQLEKYINDSTVKPVFGFSLEEHLRVTNRTIAYPLELCVCFLYEQALNEEGLLRIAAGSSRLKRMKLSFDSGLLSVPLPQEYRDVHVIAGVLKSYLRELPEPLLTYRLYDSFISAVTKNSSEEIRLNALWDVIHQLPEQNFVNLRYLIKFLSAVTKNQAVNKMSPSNIAIVIAPNLLWNDDDGGGIGFNMSNATTINCIVELLVKHADWFFKDDVNFYITLTKEELLRDIDAGKGILNQSFNPIDQANGEYGMSKSMFEYGSTTGVNSQVSNKPNSLSAPDKQTHSRSNSHDTSLILVDNEIKRTQSNSSLSDHSSPPQGSPKPTTRRKNKPTAPVPPNFVPPDKKDSPKMDATNAKDKANKTESEKPDRPPRPVISEPIKHISGIQTINRSTYKNKQVNRIRGKLSSSRENLADIDVRERRKSSESDLECHAKDECSQTDMTSIASLQQGVTNKMTVVPDSNLTNKSFVNVKSGFTAPKQHVQTSVDSNGSNAKNMPVAAPRTVFTSTKQDSETVAEVQMRPKTTVDTGTSTLAVGPKPAIPERPANIRPASFRNSIQKNQSLEMLAIVENSQNGSTTTNSNTLLERTHVYTVDKQQPTFIQVNNNNTQTSEQPVAVVAALQSEDGNRAVAQSSNSQQPDQKVLTSQMRKLSQSEGSILDVPPSPRPYHKPPRPQIPAPPPPVNRNSAEIIESTNL